MSLSPQQQANLKVAAAAAVECEQQYDLPALFTVAQWAQESGWGLHAPGCNCFGIKEYAGCSGTRTLQTTEFIHGQEEQEDQVFATFATLDDCFAYHAKLLMTGHRYATALAAFKTSGSLEGLIHNIAPIYAPGNSAYASKVIDFVHDQRIIDAVNEAESREVPQSYGA